MLTCRGGVGLLAISENGMLSTTVGNSLGNLYYITGLDPTPGINVLDVALSKRADVL